MPLRRWPLLWPTLFAAVLRLCTLGLAPADIDETWTWYLTYLWQRGHLFSEVLGLGLEAPLFLAVSMLTAEISSNTLVALRVPQAIFGTLTVPLAFAVVRHMHSRRLASTTAWLVAASPMLLYYAKHARGYSQLACFCLLWVYMLQRSEGWSARRRRFALAGAAALAVASHYYACVFLLSAHLLSAAGHLAARRMQRARSELWDGFVTFLLLTPLWLLFAAQFSQLTIHYWQPDDLGLAAVWAESFLWLGTSLPGGAGRAFTIGVAALVLAPFALAAWRSPRKLLERPLLLQAIVMPVLVAVLVGLQFVFYPRGFIGAVPFLLAGWALFTREAPVAPRLKRVYVAALLVPFVLSSVGVARSSPGQAFFKDRHVMQEIVDQIEAQPADLVVVHHWWLAMYVSYLHEDPERVISLGMWNRQQARKHGELSAVFSAVFGLPPDATILLVHNSLVQQYDPNGAVLNEIRKRRPQLRELPCREGSTPAESFLCDRLYLFGPEHQR